MWRKQSPPQETVYVLSLRVHSIHWIYFSCSEQLINHWGRMLNLFTLLRRLRHQHSTNNNTCVDRLCIGRYSKLPVAPGGVYKINALSGPPVLIEIHNYAVVSLNCKIIANLIFLALNMCLGFRMQDGCNLGKTNMWDFEFHMLYCLRCW